MKMKLFLLMLVLTACASSPHAPVSAQDRERFTPGPCAFNLPPSLSSGTNVECGVVEVPLHHQRPQGPDLRLNVAIVRSQPSKRSDVANVFLTGGPGAPTQSVLDRLEGDYLRTMGGTFDLVLFDQRGAQFSQPLICPPYRPAAEEQSVLARPLTLEDDVAGGLTYELKCRDALRDKGYDLSVYTTAESAADMDAVRAALGYGTVNLIGLSYGTYLAQRIMEKFPQSVRAVVLDGVIDPQQNWMANTPTTFMASLDRVTAACAADTACAAAYPQLRETLDALANRLEATTPVVQVTDPSSGRLVSVQTSGTMLSQVLLRLLYDTDAIGQLPLIIYLINNGSTELLASLALQLQDNSSTFAEGLYNSVMCSDVVPFTNEAEVLSHAASIAEPYRSTLLLNPLVLVRLCPLWGTSPDIQATVRTQSTAPTLLFAGAFDPVTPSKYAEGVASNLAKATMVFLPYGSHGAITPADVSTCARLLTKTFLNDPQRPLDTACTQRPITFLLPSDVGTQNAGSIQPPSGSTTLLPPLHIR